MVAAVAVFVWWWRIISDAALRLCYYGAQKCVLCHLYFCSSKQQWRLLSRNHFADRLSRRRPRPPFRCWRWMKRGSLPREPRCCYSPICSSAPLTVPRCPKYATLVHMLPLSPPENSTKKNQPLSFETPIKYSTQMIDPLRLLQYPINKIVMLLKQKVAEI